MRVSGLSDRSFFDDVDEFSSGDGPGSNSSTLILGLDSLMIVKVGVHRCNRNVQTRI